MGVFLHDNKFVNQLEGPGIWDVKMCMNPVSVLKRSTMDYIHIANKKVSLLVACFFPCVILLIDC